MLAALERFDNRTAAGLLARTALALEDYGNPAAATRLENEDRIRQAVINEAMSRLGISTSEPLNAEGIERVSEFLDSETDRISGQPDIKRAFDRLISRGEFPSDLYEIEINKNIQENLGKLYEKERLLIERTIRSPMEEQHYGPSESSETPFLISLFARRFKTEFPFKDFTMLVAGQRGNGKKLIVQQAWRLYDAQVDCRTGGDLVELLKRFSDVFGAEIRIRDQRGHFFLTAPMTKELIYSVQFKGDKEETVTISHFGQKSSITGIFHAALVVGIDQKKYLETIRRLDADIVS